MGKKNNKETRRSQYDDYEEEPHFAKKSKHKKRSNSDEFELDYFFDVDTQKRKANNRYLNKKRDKNKYNDYDEWN